MERRRNNLQVIVVRLIFLPHDFKRWREWFDALALHLLFNQSSEHIILQMIGVTLRSRKLHGEVFFSRGIVVERVHDEFHVHDLMGIEHFDDLACIAHVARETVRVPCDNAVWLPEFAFVFRKIIKVFESFDGTEEIVELRSVVMPRTHFLLHDMENVQFVPCRQIETLRELCRDAFVAVAALIGLTAIDHVVLCLLLHVPPPKRESHIADVRDVIEVLWHWCECTEKSAVRSGDCDLMERSRKFSEQFPCRKELLAVTEVLAFDEHVTVLDLVVVGTFAAPACDTENVLCIPNGSGL